ncbi:MAG TPA: T9SS type A sorting domain-containing protein, partial [Flavobacteriales bacterium]|nr:T9SS type A sorting domain-containing protein [Flavobacteriales bacterium]
GLCATDDTCQTVSTNGDAVDERPENTGLRLWPQPASDYLQLSSDSPMRAIELFDAAGRIVRHSAVNGQRFIQLDVQGSAPGAYLLRAWTDAGPVHRRWIKR